MAKGALLTLEQWEDGKRYLLNGDHASYKDFLSKICKGIGKAAPKWELPQLTADILAMLDGIRSTISGGKPFLTKETVHTSYQNYRYDASLSEQELGLKYRSLEQTINDVTALYKKTKQHGFGVLLR